MANELRRSHSNYIIRRKRQLTSKGGIYERDWMTVSEMDGFAPGSVPVYASGNFKLTVNPTPGKRKKYSFADWLLTDSGEEEWTLDDTADEIITLKSTLLNPNYSSILDFAHYGSAVELIHGTVNHVIKNFPAEIYIADNNVKCVVGEGFRTLRHVVENPFGIDISSSVVKPQDILNRYRYMCLSFKDYVIDKGSGDIEKVTQWSPGTSFSDQCLKNGDYLFTGATINNIVFDGVYISGKMEIVCRTTAAKGWHIRLSDEVLDQCFRNLDDFARTLLNRYTKPKFKAKLYTPTETDRGVTTHEVAYIWPTLKGGWNLDMESDAYTTYLQGLIDIAGYYDECRTDNIWRSYTHESIKNFDWTTPRDTYVPEIEGDLIDTERLEAILKVCGRQFDDLKRYLENIRFSYNVSYDKKNNMPDYSLGKFLEMLGWEVKNVAPTLPDTKPVLLEYPGMTVRTGGEDVNTEFLRRMILNSRNILSKKGTRAGIEAVYSMFGLFDMRYGEKIMYRGDPDVHVGFEITEWDRLTKKYITGADFNAIKDINSKKEGYMDKYNETLSYFCGIMAEEKFAIGNSDYLVPWYDQDMIYDGYQYFQMYGGWGRRARKKIDVALAPNIAEIVADANFRIYDETVKNMNVAESFDELNAKPLAEVQTGDIYYVLDLGAACNLFGYNNLEDYSHYVFLTGGTTSGDVVPYSSELGWFLVPNSEFSQSNLKWYVKKILYLESIHDVMAGNNPHNGNGIYDDGEEYFEYFKQLFKGTIANDMFSKYRTSIASENATRRYENRFRVSIMPDIPDSTASASQYRFDIDDDNTSDSRKIWFFLSDDDGLYPSTPSDYNGPGLGKRKFESDGSFTTLKPANFPLSYSRDSGERNWNWNAPMRDIVSKVDYDTESLTIRSAIKGYHREGPDDTWSYSVINTKKMTITYHLPWEMEDYVTNIVEFYVKQVIPSTVIVEFVWDYIGNRPTPVKRYASMALTPGFQTLRSTETTADIDINSVNVRNIGIASESTTNQ